MSNEISKAQERETLEEIMSLIQNIGGGASYIGMAMKGVYDVAISNIENDFGDSMAERLESANTRAAKCAMDADNYKEDADQSRTEAEASKQLHKEAREAVAILQKERNKAREDNASLGEVRREAEIQAQGLESKLRFAKQEIIELKAKLYDYMTDSSFLMRVTSNE